MTDFTFLKVPSLLACLLLLLGSCTQNSPLVHTLEELNAAIQAAQPGDSVILANGTYTDFALEFTGKGTAEAPIRLSVQEKGKVFLEGQSYLQLSGEYLEVEGLVFRNGFTPTSEVISFRTSKEALCNHCRVTECVIDNYNPAERFESDYWVGIYGKHNRFDHNYLTGKRNQGVTLAIRLDTDGSRENFNRVDHNYFGHHPVLGSNGGETIRIGTSHYSMSNSNSLVENNYFDRCNGELEIISNKSCQNTYRGNTFYECQGTLTMRHGNETLVDGNFFFGNGKPNTGGIRVINEKQRVVNNYVEGITGHRFRGALVVMNGVPNSPINRYFQVIDSEVSNNVFVDSDHVQLCAGSDNERSAVPANTRFTDNVFVNRNRENIFTVYDDISGITFINNQVDENMLPLQEAGFVRQKISLTDAGNGIKLPSNSAASDSIRVKMKTMATRENTGVSWYPIREDEQFFNTGKSIQVAPGKNTLSEAVAQSGPGDIIHLAPGEYLQSMSIDLVHPLTFVANPGKEKPVLLFEKASLFNIENGGALTLKGVQVNGRECNDRPLNSVIRTSRYSMINNYKLFIEDCDFVDLDVNHSFNVLRVFKNTFADSIVVRNSSFKNVSGTVLALDQETDDIGIYNAENVVLENCLFDNIGGAALHLHRGGNDESTFGPMLVIDRCTFDEVGGDKRNKTNSSVSLHGVQFIQITNSIFDDSAPLDLHLVVGEPVVTIEDCVFSGGTKLVDNGEPYQINNVRLNEPEPLTELAGGKQIGTQLMD